jgi:predicted nucleic acid-binding protein
LTGPFVLDASMTLSWASAGESTPFTVAVLRSLKTVHAIAPAEWAFEVASVLSTAERRGRMNAAAQTAFLERLRLLPVAIEPRPGSLGRFFRWRERTTLAPMMPPTPNWPFAKVCRSPRSITTSAVPPLAPA